MIARGSSLRGLSRGDDRNVGEPPADLSHDRTLAAIAIAAAAEHAEHAAGAEPAGCNQHVLEGLRRVRVIDQDREWLPLVDQLEPSGDALEVFDPGGDRARLDAEQPTGGRGSENVLDVEAAPQARLADVNLVRPEVGVVGKAEGDELAPSPRSSSASCLPCGSPMLTAAGGSPSTNSRRFASK